LVPVFFEKLRLELLVVTMKMITAVQKGYIGR